MKEGSDGPPSGNLLIFLGASSYTIFRDNIKCILKENFDMRGVHVGVLPQKIFKLWFKITQFPASELIFSKCRVLGIVLLPQDVIMYLKLPPHIKQDINQSWSNLVKAQCW